MPWSTPNLVDVRRTNRDYIVGRLGVPLIPNSVGRVLADANGGNAHLALQYLDWLSLQLLPDTAETQFLDKWGNIYLVNADGSRGRKQATFASGTVTATGITGAVLPSGSRLTGPTSAAIAYETVAALTLGASPAPVTIRALDAGAAGNLDAGMKLSLASAVSGVNGQSVVVAAGGLIGGANEESDDELRVRVLARIRQPPMGGDADDYVNWALEVAGVTRAWCAPNEVSVGTVTLRIMCDDLRASSGGLPTADDLAAVHAFVDTVRPVTVKEFFVVSPTFQPVDFAVTNLQGDSVALRNAIAAGVKTMLRQRAKPASALNGVLQPATTIPAAWVSEAIYAATAGVFFDLQMSDAVMANDGCLAVLGAIG